MANRKNFLNQRDTVFPSEVLDAAMRNAGDDDYSAVLLGVLEKAHTVSVGVAEILNMQRQNELRRFDFELGEDDGLEPPLSECTMDILNGLAQFACEAICHEISETADMLGTRHETDIAARLAKAKKEPASKGGAA